MTFNSNDISIVIYEDPDRVQHLNFFGNDGTPFSYNIKFKYIHMSGSSVSYVAGFTFLRFFLQGLMSCGVNVRQTKPFLEAIAP